MTRKHWLLFQYCHYYLVIDCQNYIDDNLLKPSKNSLHRKKSLHNVRIKILYSCILWLLPKSPIRGGSRNFQLWGLGLKRVGVHKTQTCLKKKSGGTWVPIHNQATLKLSGVPDMYGFSFVIWNRCLITCICVCVGKLYFPSILKLAIPLVMQSSN